MKHPEGKLCLNCLQPLQEGDKYCGACGQRDEPPLPRFSQMVTDFLGDYFSFDAKLWRSVGPLLYKPGYLTKAFWSGKHMRYIPPLRMFLFLSVVFVLLLNFTIEPDKLMSGITTPDENGQIALMSLDEADSAGSPVIALDSMIRSLYPAHSPAAIADTILSNRADVNRFTRLVVAQIVKLQVSRGAALASYLISNTTLILSILLVLLALLLKIVTWKRHLPFLAHLVASLHIHAVLLLLMLVLQLTGNLFTGKAVWIIMAGMSIYIFFAIRNAYRQNSRFVLRPIAIAFVYNLIFLPVTMVIALLAGFLLM